MDANAALQTQQRVIDWVSAETARAVMGYVPAEILTRDFIASGERFAPVGSLVLSGYWGTVDQVLEHIAHDDWRGESVKVVEVAHPESRNTLTIGRVREHSTRFDPKRDRIVGTVAS